MISDVVYELYKEAGVFEVSDKENWKEEVPERSSLINFQSIYKKMEEKRDQLVGS